VAPLPAGPNRTGTPLFAIGVVAHTSRHQQAHTLSDTVNADYLSVDDGTLGCEANHHDVQASLADLPTTWSVVLEDDAEPMPGFIEQLHQALPMSPSPIVSFYLGRRRPPQWQNRILTAIGEAANTDSPWIVSTHLLHAVAYAIRTSLLPSLLAHESTHPIDEHIGDWARRHGNTVAYTVPSLVDHADLPTIVKHRDGQPRRPGRRAWTVGSRESWSSRAVVMT